MISYESLYFSKQHQTSTAVEINATMFLEPTSTDK